MHIKKVLSSRIFWGHQVLRTKATVSTAIILLLQTLYTDSSCLSPHVTFDLHSSRLKTEQKPERKKEKGMFMFFLQSLLPGRLQAAIVYGLFIWMCGWSCYTTCHVETDVVCMAVCSMAVCSMAVC